MSDYCPLIQKKCKEHKCKFFIQVMGKNPNTGQDVSEFNCAISWLPMLLIEGTQQTRQAGAAIESFRNEVVKTQTELNFIGGRDLPDDKILHDNRNAFPIDNKENKNIEDQSTTEQE